MPSAKKLEDDEEWDDDEKMTMKFLKVSYGEPNFELFFCNLYICSPLYKSIFIIYDYKR